MRYEEIMSPEGVKYIQQDELRELLVKKIGEMTTDMAELLYTLLEQAAQKALNAGYSGEKHDGGAGRLVGQVEMFVHGWFKLIPRDWTLLQGRLKAQKDPEWVEYQRLKKKFEEARK
jgi:hypothetical protein